MSQTPKNRMKQAETQEQPLHSRITSVPQQQHKCPSCGKWVCFSVSATRGPWTYCSCPACGARHALNLSRQTARPVQPQQ